MKNILIALTFLLAPTLCLAEAGDTSVVEVWQCTLNDGKTAKEVAAHNAKWLAFVRQASPEINSYGMQRIVGEGGPYMFADVYPDIAIWGAAKSLQDSDEGRALEQGFNELLECSSNRLYNSTQH